MKTRLLLACLLFLGAISSQASDFSQRVLAEMNLARTQPQAYAEILAARMGGSQSSKAVREAIRFLERAEPRPPLDLSQGMSLGARAHVMDIGPRGARGHYGRGGSSPFERINRYGKWLGRAGENIYYGRRDARGVVCALIVDEGVPGRKHRQNIFSPAFNVAGIAYGSHAGFGAMCVMNFATRFVERGAALAGL